MKKQKNERERERERERVREVSDLDRRVERDGNVVEVGLGAVDAQGGVVADARQRAEGADGRRRRRQKQQQQRQRQRRPRPHRRRHRVTPSDLQCKQTNKQKPIGNNRPRNKHRDYDDRDIRRAVIGCRERERERERALSDSASITHRFFFFYYPLIFYFFFFFTRLVPHRTSAGLMHGQGHSCSRESIASFSFCFLFALRFQIRPRRRRYRAVSQVDKKKEHPNTVYDQIGNL